MNLPGSHQDPTRNLSRTFQEPTRHIPGTYQDPTRNLPGTYQKPTRSNLNYIKNNKNMLPKWLKNRPQNHRKCSQNDPRGAPGERSWNLPGALGKKTSISSRIWSLFGSSGGSLGHPGGIHFRPWTPPRTLPRSPGDHFSAIFSESRFGP